ncbi:preferentially expressed antigen in melanoma-like protein [Camelus ferus]|nr:preferentially expressed antigen in melanoma-like protein [Camelus ferus]
MHMPHAGTFQAVLDGLDVLLAQKAPPSLASLAEDISRTEQPLAPLEVIIELCLKERILDGFLTYLLRWAEQKRDSVHLCCRKLRTLSVPVGNTMKAQSLAQLDCIQMTNVQRLRVSVSEEQELQRVVQFTSQILRLHHLWDPHLESPFSLEGRLDQMFRCLMTPLDSLAITHCFLEESDLTHLSWCPNISQLKGLDLSGVSLTDFSPEPLQVLLEKVAATLQELNLNQYGIMDPQLESVLPALSRCSQLRSFSLCGSPLSTAVMGKLPSHTAGLPRLSQEGFISMHHHNKWENINQVMKIFQ